MSFHTRNQSTDTGITLACTVVSNTNEEANASDSLSCASFEEEKVSQLEDAENHNSDAIQKSTSQSSLSTLSTQPKNEEEQDQGEEDLNQSATFSVRSKHPLDISFRSKHPMDISIRSNRPADAFQSTTGMEDSDDEDEDALQKGLYKAVEEEEEDNQWIHFMNYVRHILTEGVTVIATVAAKNPKITAWGITFLSFALVGVGVLTNFNMDVAADAMYTPKNSRIVEHQHWVQEMSGFPAAERNLRMIIHSDDGEGNVLNKETVESVFRAIDTVRETPGYHEACADSDFTDDHGNHTCRIRGVTLYWNNSLDIFHSQVPSDTDVILQASNHEYPDQSPVDVLEIMGRTTTHRDTLIVDARAFFVDIALPSTAEDFELDAIDNLLKLRKEWNKDSKLGLELLAASSLEDETTRSVFRDIPLVPAVFVVMSCFTCWVFSKRDAVKSRSLLGLGAVVCVFLSVISGYGFMWIVGVNFTSLSQILPFVMFGIGLDDAFIMIGAYNRTDPNKDVVERIQDATRDIGLSIVLTTVTTSTAFGLGCLSNLPALYWLSFYSFTCMILVFLYTITFFVALIVLDERRIQANRRDCCFCMSVVEDTDENSLQITIKDSIESAEEGRARPVVQKKESKIRVEGETNDNDPVIRFMSMYADFLMKPVVKVLVLLAAAAFFCFCAYSTSLFRQEFNVTEMLPGDSYAKEYMSASDKFGQRGWIVPSAYFRGVDQSDPNVQDKMEDYINMMVDEVDAITSQPPLFWLRHFKKFLTYDDRLLELTFNQQIDIFLSHSPFKELFGPHIVRDEETGDIIASRCTLYMDNVDVNSVENQLAALMDQRAVSASHPSNAGTETFNFFLWEINMFTWDFFGSTPDELLLTTVLGVFAVCVIGFCFIPHWTAVIYLFPFISILYIDLMGYLQFTGNALNVVSYFALVISIGLLVDFLMHVLLRYYESECSTREEKVKDTLRTMGSSILVGGLSTMLGVLPLAFSTSELMRTVFVAFIGMVALGVTHGLCVLPVVLSLCGSETPMKEYKPKPKPARERAETEPSYSSSIPSKESSSSSPPSPSSSSSSDIPANDFPPIVTDFEC